MFDSLKWHPDRMVLGDLVFHLETEADASWRLRDSGFVFYKQRFQIEQYAHLWNELGCFAASNIIELGIYDGGSIAFWYEHFHPSRLVGIDSACRGESSYFRWYRQSRSIDSQIKLYWHIDQSDRRALEVIADLNFAGSLDLVIDDASHLYAPTKTSFEVLFPRLRPGGLYIIEDWSWSSWTSVPSFMEERLDSELSHFIFEITEAVGSANKNHSCREGGPRYFDSLLLWPDIAVIRRGDKPWDGRKRFSVDEHRTAHGRRRRWV